MRRSGPSVIITKKEVKRLADLKGLKLRVLASPFQMELIRRMDANPVAMTLADVLPGIQQGTIDGALSAMTVYTTMQYHDAAKNVLENDQPYINSIVVMSKRWLATLPPDLQKIIHDNGAKVSKDTIPFVKEFVAKQYDIWKSRGGLLNKLPAERAGGHDRQGQHHRRGPVEGQAGPEQGGEAGVRGGQPEMMQFRPLRSRAGAATARSRGDASTADM